MEKINNKKSTKGPNSPIIGGDASGSNFGTIYFNNTPINKAREVRTIHSLISLITKNSSNIDISQNKELEKDLKEKIYNRFKTHKEELISEFTKLSIWHGASYSSVVHEAGLTDTQLDKIAEYLRRESKKYLKEANDNPIQALGSLTDFFNQSLSVEEKKIDYEISAIRFYLFKQLINCNVFPNPEDL